MYLHLSCIYTNTSHMHWYMKRGHPCEPSKGRTLSSPKHHQCWPIVKDCQLRPPLFGPKGKQQDSTWGPSGGFFFSWKRALAHGLECTQALIFQAVGAHSPFIRCREPVPEQARLRMLMLLTCLMPTWRLEFAGLRDFHCKWKWSGKFCVIVIAPN